MGAGLFRLGRRAVAGGDIRSSSEQVLGVARSEHRGIASAAPVPADDSQGSAHGIPQSLQDADQMVIKNVQAATMAALELTAGEVRAQVTHLPIVAPATDRCPVYPRVAQDTPDTPDKQGMDDWLIVRLLVDREPWAAVALLVFLALTSASGRRNRGHLRNGVAGRHRKPRSGERETEERTGQGASPP